MSTAVEIRIAARRRIDQTTKIIQQADVGLAQWFASAPDRRTRLSGNAAPSRSSTSARPIVLRAMPVARETALTPRALRPWLQPPPSAAVSARPAKDRAPETAVGWTIRQSRADSINSAARWESQDVQKIAI